MNGFRRSLAVDQTLCQICQVLAEEDYYRQKGAQMQNGIQGQALILKVEDQGC